MIHTVLGDVDGAAVGYCSMHEHLYGDFWTNYYSGIGKLEPSCFLPLTLENYGLVRRDPGALRENLILTDETLTTRELHRYRDAGGSLIVDATVRGSSPDANALLRLSKASGVHVVAPTGFYIADTLSNEQRSMSVGEMTDLWIQDIEEGIDGTGIRAGVIGELGAIGEMDIFEKKILESGARAQKATGAAILLHTACPSTLYDSPHRRTWRERTHMVLDYLEACGADLDRVVVGHPDVSELNSFEDQMDILRRGIVLEYDNFGQEHPYDRENTYAFSDWQRVKNIFRFVAAGYASRLVIASDLWQKAQYTAYGGWGFDHILTNILPMLRRNGMDEDTIRQITIETPHRLLDF